MKKGIFFLKGILALALVFGLVLAACDNGTQEIKGKISLSKMDDPVVTLQLVTGGVKLSWPPVIEADQYRVLRKSGEQTAPVELKGNNATLNKGIYEYYDLVGVDNELASNTSYTYTVIALPWGGVKNIGKSEKAITTGTIPARGSQAAEPANVDLAINFGDKTITVTVMPSTTGIIPNYYDVKIGKNGYGNTDSRKLYPDNLTWTFYGDENSLYGDAYTVYSWFNNPDGEYYADVFGYISSPSSSDDDYFKVSDTVTEFKEVKPLFGYYSYIYLSSDYITGTNPNTISGFYTSIDLSYIVSQLGVTYTIEKAVLDEDDKPGAFTPVTLYKRDGLNTDGSDKYTQVSLSLDIFGNLNLSETIVYDQPIAIPRTKVKYQYRIKAVNQDNTITDYREEYITIDPQDYINLSILVAAKGAATGGNVPYDVTPSLSFKGLLQPNDKLVLYWIKGDDQYCYRTGPYETAKSISFSQTELEAATVREKKLNIPVNPGATTQYVYVQAYLEFANGDKQQIANWSGDGLYNPGNPGTVNNGQYHVQLDF